MEPMVPCMDFGAALNAMREDEQRVRRVSWNEGTVIGIRWPEGSTLAEPYFYAEGLHGHTIAWPVTHRDLFAVDWEIAP